MSEGRSRWQWNHTSHLLAMVANTIPQGEDAEPFYANDFNPYAAAQTSRDDVIHVSPTEGVKLLGQMYAGLGS